MARLLYYNPNVAVKEAMSLPGMERFSHYFKLYRNPTISFVDRTGTITSPIAVKSLFPIPPFRRFTKSFEEICDDRAQELLEYAEREDRQVYLVASGGIDSTT